MKERAIPRELFRSMITPFCEATVEMGAALARTIASLLDLHDGKVISRFDRRGSKVAIVYA
jgi:hypothetical protein